MTSSPLRPVRVGAVSYLNSKPLIEGLDRYTDELDLSLNYPSRLADDLAEGLLDVGLIPSIELLRNPDYEVISDACVASSGSVMSVKVYSSVDVGDIRRLASDEGSRTSTALAQVILGERYGVEPELETLPLGLSTDSTDADAVLLIGDRAMHPPVEEFVETWDLGDEWYRWTGLPFVFAVWAARLGSDLGPVEEILGEARNRGVENIDQIAAREAPQLDFSETTANRYLKQNLSYHLGSAQRNGLRLFQRLAAKRELVHQGVELAFRNHTPA